MTGGAAGGAGGDAAGGAGGDAAGGAAVGAVSLVAPAKLTVRLHLTGVRADGYHLIDAEMVSLDLHDLVTIDPAGRGVTTGGPFAEGVPLDAGNLVQRALDLARRTARVHLDKRIPHGGGLGGGSTDAAAVLRWAGVTDLELAASIGADVPFCLVGGRAHVTGIGEVVEPLPTETRTFTLVIPPFGVATPAVYRAWDELGGPSGDVANHLEAAAVQVDPRLARWRDLIREHAGATPVLAGSGATWFVHGDRTERLAPLREHGATVLRASTIAA